MDSFINYVNNLPQMIKKLSKSKIKYLGGMTLVELMVVVTIFIVVSGITIFDYRSFSSDTSLSNLADDIALSIRKAQSYAIGTRVSGSNEFRAGYGIHITTGSKGKNALAGDSKSFVLFTDFTSTGSPYVFPNKKDAVCGTPTADNECSEILNINTGDEVVGIYLSGNNFDPSVNQATLHKESVIDIVFVRPNPDALFCYKINNNSQSSCLYSGNEISSVAIEVSNGKEGDRLRTKKISVYNTGQISVE